MEVSFAHASFNPLLPRHRAFAEKPRPFIRYKAGCSRMRAAGNGTNPDRDHYGGRLVDENLVELRKRIREAKVNDIDHPPPAEWTKWEKQYHKYYRSDVCQLIGLLQIALMNTRPSTALALLALLSLSLPTSLGMIMINLFAAAKELFPGA